MPPTVSVAALATSVPTPAAAPHWERTLIYNYPEVRTRSLRWLAVHTVHDVHHHLRDIQRQII